MVLIYELERIFKFYWFNFIFYIGIIIVLVGKGESGVCFNMFRNGEFIFFLGRFFYFLMSFNF